MSDYKIHNVLGFSLKNVNNNPLTDTLWSWTLKQYEAFLCSSVVHPDLEFHIGPFISDLADCYILDDKCYVREDYLYTTADYKFTKFEFDITGWESGTFKVRVSCNLPGFLIVSGLIIDPLLLYALIQRQVLPVHAACIADERGAYLFAGSSGTGKTSVCLDLMEEGYDLLGDNYTLFSNGRVYSFLSPLNIFTYNLAPAVKKRVSQRTLAILKAKGLLWKATGGYIKIFTKINPAHLWPGQTRSTQATPRAVFFLVKSDRFQTGRISPQSLAAALVANMRLEIPRVLEWLARYTFVNPTFALPQWMVRYETRLAENLSRMPHLLRVEIPEAYDSSVTRNIQALMRDV
jgi:hypothetical protein